MLSALISSAYGYAALPLTGQLPHQKCVILGPLVLENEPLKFPSPTVDKDRTVSRRSEPSSRTALTGEQPDPWDLLQPQDAMSRHRVLIHDFAWYWLYLVLTPGFRSRDHVLGTLKMCCKTRRIILFRQLADFFCSKETRISDFSS